MTCNNRFSSMLLVEYAREKLSLTMVGCLRQNKSELPSIFKILFAKGTYHFAYDNKTLMSYNSENDKMVLLLPSLRSDGKMNKVENKPEKIIYYNKIKGAIDTFHRLRHKYTVHQGAHWWMQIFYAGSGGHSSVLYTLNADN